MRGISLFARNMPVYSAVQLCQLDDHNFPVRFASGCLICLGERKLFLSVGHATGNDGKWAIQMGYDKVRGVANYVVGEMRFIMRIGPSTTNQSILGFSYVEIPSDVIPARHFVNIHGDTVSQGDIVVFGAPFDARPEFGEYFSFEGAVKPLMYQNLFNTNHVVYEVELMTYEGLIYLRREDDFFVFQLPFKHPGHEWFKGCSGAPILNSSGHPVGLISKGNLEADEIFATALDALIPVVEATLDQEENDIAPNA